MLTVFRGLPGTGKSFLARQLVEACGGFHVLSRDVLRASLLPRPTFSPEEKALIDDLVCAMTGFLLGRGLDVLIDGMALSSSKRVNELVRIAAAHASPVRIIECVCAEATALSRIARDAGGHPAGDRGEALYFEVKARFEPIVHPFLTVDTDRDPAESLAAVRAYLQR